MKQILALLIIFTSLLCAVAQNNSVRIMYGPYLQNIDTNEATITWVTDTPSVGWIELAHDGNDSFYNYERQRYYDTTDGIKNISTIHSVTIKGLSSNTTYRYRTYAQAVVSHEGNRVMYGDYAATNVYSQEPLRFTTLCHEAEQVSFAVINDIHGDNNRMSNLIAQCDLSATDLFIFNGDMASMYNSEEQIFGDFVNTAVSTFAGETPFYYTRGNHETRGSYAHKFHDYFSTGSSSLYYTFRQGPVLFVILDSGEDKADSDIEYYGLVEYDNYRTRQAEWLEGVINSEAYRNAPLKVVVSHIPPMGDWHGNNEVKNKFVEVLRQAAPDIMLCAHEHELIYSESNSNTPFPILINAHNTIVKVKATQSNMQIDIVDEKGKTIATYNYSK